jgi:beta-glucosidase
VSIGASSRDLRATATVAVKGDLLRLPITLDSTLGEAMADPTAAPVLGEFLARSTPAGMDSGDNALGVDMARMIASIPLKRLAGFGGTGPAELEKLITALNTAREEAGHRERGDR